ncbi:MAG: AhpC/TSA family protein [Bacteroidales bacterium]|nr:MAG: AhpC/TSA family protein [Bacteroidales bacterium]
MRRSILILSVILTAACTRSGKILIHGKLTGVTNKFVYLEEVNINENILQDSAKINKNGTFRITIRSGEPNFYQLKLSENNFITLLAKPGERIDLYSDESFLPNGYTVSGSESSSLIKILDDKLFDTQKKLDSIVSVYKASMNLSGFDTLQVQLDQAYSKVVNDQRRFSISFIIEHLSSLASIKALYQKFDTATYVLYEMTDLQYLKIVADSLKVYYPDSKHTKTLVADLEKELAEFNAQRISTLMDSAPSFIDLALPNPQGDTIYLSSLRGKYVLLSFWASWNEESIKENIELKTIYDQYHLKGFEIYQVSFDNDRESWEKAVRFDEIPWINVSDLEYPNSNVPVIFNIQNLPANYLLDREGSIIGKDFTIRALKIKLGQLFD